MTHRPARHRPRHRTIAVSAAAAALLGAVLLITGLAGLTRSVLVAGIPTEAPGHRIGLHLAARSAAGHTVIRPAAGTAKPPAPPSPAATPPSTQKPQGAQLPNTIRLPRGGTAYLVHTEVGADGSLPVPSGVNQAAWWGTAVNGPTGATVFAGHVNWAGRTGPFAELWHDDVGDVVSVRDDAGAVFSFRITQVLTLDKDQLPQQAPALFSPTGPHRIVLATCGGEWIGGDLGYNENRVVIATPIP